MGAHRLMGYPMTDSWRIELGYEGPTDCCLVLVYCDGKNRKEYLIESVAWQLLAIYWDAHELMDNRLASWIWYNRDEDLRGAPRRD